MRVDTPEHGPHDHSFGHGATHPEQHEVGLGSDQVTAHDAIHNATHGLFNDIGHEAAAAALGGHVEVGHFDAGHDPLHGLDGLHDSIHHSIGLGFGGDEHHTLHDGLHHDPQHDVAHDTHHDVAHDIGHIL